MVADTVAQAMAWLRAWVITPPLEHFVALQASQIEERHEVLAKANAGDFATAAVIAAPNTTYQF